MKTKTLVTVLVVIGLIAVAGCFLPLGGGQSVIERVVGADAGPDHYGLNQFLGGMIRGNYNATTTGTTVVLTQGDLIGYDVISVTPIVGATTWTFMASSSAINLVPKAGMMQETCLINASTTAGITLTLAAGTGIDLERASTTAVLQPDSVACLKFIRKAATASAFDIAVEFIGYAEAD